MSDMNLTPADLELYVEMAPQEVKKDLQDALTWVRTNQERDLREPLRCEGHIHGQKCKFSVPIPGLCVNAVMYRDGYVDCDDPSVMKQFSRWRDHRIDLRKRNWNSRSLPAGNQLFPAQQNQPGKSSGPGIGSKAAIPPPYFLRCRQDAEPPPRS